MRDCSGKAETPQEHALRRLSAAPRKAKCLERKSTAFIYKAKKNRSAILTLLFFMVKARRFRF
ncbi:hypothetical protein EVU96_21060 [Bacillus infantis]|nr:hypothetical protein EVU96_21060 [Bacillus infantis]